MGQEAVDEVYAGEDCALLGIARIADERGAQLTLGRHPRRPGRGKGWGYPLAAIGRTRERIWPMRPAFTCPRAMAIITARARPTRVCILACPRMKWRSKPKLLSMRLLIRSRALRRL
jgi:hypothetical protein